MVILGRKTVKPITLKDILLAINAAAMLALDTAGLPFQARHHLNIIRKKAKQGLEEIGPVAFKLGAGNKRVDELWGFAQWEDGSDDSTST